MLFLVDQRTPLFHPLHQCKSECKLDHILRPGKDANGDNTAKSSLQW